jgi:hypothetical protein
MKKAETSVKVSTRWERIAAPRNIWIVPNAPRPNSFPRTGKKRVKNLDGHPISERMRTMVWPMMKRRFRTAQKAPAGWLGTVLPLSQQNQVS